MITRLLPDAAEARRLVAIEAAAFGAGHRSWDRDGYVEAGRAAGTAIFADPEIARGFVLVRVASGEGEILNLAVHPAAQRTGQARALMARAEEWAAARGAEAMFLEVALDAVAARQLYSRLGYRMVGRRRDYYDRGAEARVDALVLMKLLDAPGGAV